MSKFCNSGDMDDYRKNLDSAFWQQLGRSADDPRWAQFSDQAALTDFVATLNDSQLATTTKFLSQMHNNGMAKNIAKYESWEPITLSMEKLEVEYTETVLRPAVKQCSHELLSVAVHHIVVEHSSYKHRNLHTDVAYSVYLGRPMKPEKTRLVDGNHRAIHQARQFLAGIRSQKHLNLVVPVL
jgi:hypothetical protein